MLETIFLGPGNIEDFPEELSTAQFITYAAFSSLSGVGVGNLINEGGGWLRFKLDDKELVVAKRTLETILAVSIIQQPLLDGVRASN